MNKRRIQVAVILGILAIIAIISFQFIWLKEAFNQEKRKFNQSVHIALLEVVKLVVNDNQSQFPHTNPVQKVSEDYYLVKINDGIDAKILEFYLKNEFEKLHIKTDFEYAIYDCSNDEMVYGNYVSLLNRENPKRARTFFPKMEGLVYYFAVRFQEQPVFLTGQTGAWSLVALISLVILIIYIYSLFVILSQNRYYELQKNFINNMTHEFKTPLSSILLASQYLRESGLVQQDDRLEKYSNAIIHQGKRLNEQVERILSLSKSEKGILKPIFSTINLNDTLREIVGQMEVLLSGEQKIELLLSNEEIIIKGDKNHFINMVNNLLDNALKYSQSSVKISISSGIQNNTVLLKINDEGPGIPGKHLRRVFDKFYRIPQNDGRVIKGFGLGLFYVKNICSLHGWKIAMESRAETGTTFTIKIPKYHGQS